MIQFREKKCISDYCSLSENQGTFFQNGYILMGKGENEQLSAVVETRENKCSSLKNPTN